MLLPSNQDFSTGPFQSTKRFQKTTGWTKSESHPLASIYSPSHYKPSITLLASSPISLSLSRNEKAKNTNGCISSSTTVSMSASSDGHGSAHQELLRQHLPKCRKHRPKRRHQQVQADLCYSPCNPSPLLPRLYGSGTKTKQLSLVLLKLTFTSP